MDSQLEAVRQEVFEVKGKIANTEQKLAAAEHAPNGNKDLLLSLNNQLLSLNNQVLSLNEKENILLRNQAPSKPCTLWLACVHAILRSIQLTKRSGIKNQMRIILVALHSSGDIVH